MARKEAYTVSKMLQSINDVMAPVATESNASVSLKRRLNNGIMLDTRPEEIALLDLQAKCKHAAQEVATLQQFGGDLQEWLEDVRRQGNDLFHAAKYREAADVYVQALTGLDFGTSPEQRRMCQQQVQLPLTCNLVACLLMLEQWEKARQVCDLAVRIDPSHCRLLSLRAKASTRLGRFEDARTDLRFALDCHDQSSDSSVTEASLQKQLAAVDKSELRERSRRQQQREFSSKMMHRAMGALYSDKDSRPLRVDSMPVADGASRDEAIAVPQPSIARWIAYYLANALLFLIGIVTGNKHQPQ